MNIRARLARLEAAEPEPEMDWIVLYDDDPLPDSTGPVYRMVWPADYEQETLETPAP